MVFDGDVPIKVDIRHASVADTWTAIVTFLPHYNTPFPNHCAPARPWGVSAQFRALGDPAQVYALYQCLRFSGCALFIASLSETPNAHLDPRRDWTLCGY